MIKDFFTEADDIVHCDDCHIEVQFKETVLMGDDTVCQQCALLDIGSTSDYFVDIPKEEEVNDWKH